MTAGNGRAGRVRQRDAVNARVTPAVALTPHASEDDQVRARAAGFGCHVAKPYNTAALLTVVATCVSRTPSREGPCAHSTCLGHFSRS